MISFFLAIGAFFRSIWHGLKDREFRAMFFTVLILLVVGMLFYMKWEGWVWYDALLFCVTTLTTIGYGDRVPTHPGTKIFTIFYIFLGIGILLAFINKVAAHAFASRKQAVKPEEEVKAEKGK
jgi:voltage-gated potassium channel